MRPCRFQSSGASPGLLEHLPDYTTGWQALEGGRFGDAVAPLTRAVDVAESYFPPTAARERVLCHWALGYCLWQDGRYVDAARRFEAGSAAARGGHGALVEGVPPGAASILAHAAASACFEVGNFEAARAQIKAADNCSNTACLAEAIAAVDGAPPQCPDGDDVVSLGRQMNVLTGTLLQGGDATEGSLSDAAMQERLANLTAEGGALAVGTSMEASAAEFMSLRSTAGQLIVLTGVGGREQARALLATALKDFEAIQTPGTDLKPWLFRTLATLGVLLDQREPVSAEGLFRAALDHMDVVDEATKAGPLQRALSHGRGRVWQAQVLLGYAAHLEQSRRAEQRASEAESLRLRAGSLCSLSPLQLRWSLLWLPPPRPPVVAELGF